MDEEDAPEEDAPEEDAPEEATEERAGPDNIEIGDSPEFGRSFIDINLLLVYSYR